MSTWLVFNAKESQKQDTSDLCEDFHGTGNCETGQPEGTADRSCVVIMGAFI